MGTDNRDKKRHLIHQLMKEAKAFDFFEAVRRIEQLNSDKPRMGCGTSPDDEAVRFGQEPSLAFATSTIADFQVNTGSDAARMIVNFFGLLGPNGPMPLHVTEFVRSRALNYYDPTLQRFLDIFHHRLIALFYRAWALNEQAVSYDRPDDDWISHFVGSLIGLDSRQHSDRNDKVPFYGKCYWAGRLIQVARNSEGLEAILADYFDVPVAIEEFKGSWLDIPEQYYLELGKNQDNATLGMNAVLGDSYYTKTEKFKIIVGPLDLSRYEELLPCTDSYARLKDWVNSYLVKPLQWDLEVILKAEEVPQTTLGSYGQLGYTSWLKSQPVAEDKDDLLVHA